MLHNLGCLRPHHFFVHSFILFSKQPLLMPCHSLVFISIAISLLLLLRLRIDVIIGCIGCSHWSLLLLILLMCSLVLIDCLVISSGLLTLIVAWVDWRLVESSMILGADFKFRMAFLLVPFGIGLLIHFKVSDSLLLELVLNLLIHGLTPHFIHLQILLHISFLLIELRRRQLNNSMSITILSHLPVLGCSSLESHHILVFIWLIIHFILLLGEYVLTCILHFAFFSYHSVIRSLPALMTLQNALLFFCQVCE